MTADEALDWIEACRAKQHPWRLYIQKSPQRLAAVRALYDAEVSIQQIAQVIDLCEKTVRADLGIVSCGQPKAPNQRARNREIFAARQTGEHYNKIGARYGISTERVRQICKKEARLERGRAAREQAAQEMAAEAERIRAIAAEREGQARTARYAQALATGRFVPLEQFAAVHTPETEWQAMAAEANP